MRSMMSLPAIVMSSEPTPAATVRVTGVIDRRRRARIPQARIARIGIPIGPKTYATVAANPSTAGDRSPATACSTGLSRLATPSASVTAS